jgi:hypothetical protein
VGFSSSAKEHGMPWGIASSKVCKSFDDKMVVVRMNEVEACLGWTGHACDDMDMELLYASIDIVIAGGETIKFSHSPWLDGFKPIDISSSILVSKLMNFTVHKAIDQDFLN